MTADTQQDRALDCADQMEILASQYKQMGFNELSKWVRLNAKAARKWAAEVKP